MQEMSVIKARFWNEFTPAEEDIHCIQNRILAERELDELQPQLETEQVGSDGEQLSSTETRIRDVQEAEAKCKSATQLATDVARKVWLQCLTPTTPKRQPRTPLDQKDSPPKKSDVSTRERLKPGVVLQGTHQDIFQACAFIIGGDVWFIFRPGW